MAAISIITPCFNEEDNVRELHQRIAAVIATRPQHTWRHLFIDNASTDGTVAILRELAAEDPRVGVIVNVRNFGHIRSPFHGLLAAPGDAVIILASDLQDPPELIPTFVDAWEKGAKVVMGVKKTSEETWIFWALRSTYYRLARWMADVELIEHATGFGMYDRRILKLLARLGDPYPYFRGLISEIGYPVVRVPYEQPLRKRGVTKNNFYTLWDMAMLGLTTHSRVPLRLATLFGFVLGACSFGLALGYLVLKLVSWDAFQLGWAPLLVGTFFLASVQLVSLGVLGEYVGAVLTQVRGVPHVFERERFGAAPPSDETLD
jgi:glycosyltransferase involved in cell wall biosynthesis